MVTFLWIDLYRHVLTDSGTIHKYLKCVTERMEIQFEVMEEKVCVEQIDSPVNCLYPLDSTPVLTLGMDTYAQCVYKAITRNFLVNRIHSYFEPTQLHFIEQDRSIKLSEKFRWDAHSFPGDAFSWLKTESRFSGLSVRTDSASWFQMVISWRVRRDSYSQSLRCITLTDFADGWFCNMR